MTYLKTDMSFLFHHFSCCSCGFLHVSYFYYTVSLLENQTEGMTKILYLYRYFIIISTKSY